MRITIIGATGKSGRFLVQEGIERGHNLSLLVRNPDNIPGSWKNSEHINVITGDALDSGSLESACSDADCVLVAIGHTKGSPPDLQLKFIQKLLPLIEGKRLIAITGAGVPADGDRPGLLDKFTNFMLKLVDPARLNDGIEFSRYVKDNADSLDINWTIVRTGLQKGSFHNEKVNNKPHNYKVGMVGEGGFSVSRANLAHYIYQIREDKNKEAQNNSVQMPYIWD